MPRQTSMQLTPAQERQLEALRVAGYGNTSDIIRIAIDRMYNKEIGIKLENRNLTDDDLKLAAQKAVSDATNDPLTIVDYGGGYKQEASGTWHGLEGFDEQVIYGNGVWTVGGNGDATDFTTAEQAISALVYQWKIESSSRLPIVRSNRNLTDNAWVRRVDELRQYVSDQYDPALGTPENFVELAKELGDYDNDDLAVILQEVQRLAEQAAE